MEHQLEAIRFGEELTEFACFMDQGTGKSKVAIDIASDLYAKGAIDSLIVIAPNGVHKQWVTEQLPAHCSVPYFAAQYGGKRTREDEKALGFVMTDNRKIGLRVLCINVDTFSSESAWKMFTDWSKEHNTMLVLDEATRIKNITAKRTKHIIYGFSNCQYRNRALVSAVPFTKYRMALTGTPITESPVDAWAIFEMLRPGYFKMTHAEFKQHFGMYYKNYIYVAGRKLAIDKLIDKDIWQKIKQCKNYNEAYTVTGILPDLYDYIKKQQEYEGKYRNIQELKDLIKPISFFKTKEECLDLPGKTYTKRVLQMADEQKRVYNALVQEMIAVIDDKMLPVTNKTALLIRLRQVTSGFIPMQRIDFNENGEIDVFQSTPIPGPNPKLNALLEDLDECRDQSLIATCFTAEAKAIYDALNKKYDGEKRIGIVTGSHQYPSNAIEAFKRKEVDILVANNKIIAFGWNLQQCFNILFYNNDFSLETRMQLEDRLYRFGQKNKVLIKDYVCENTVDLKVYDALIDKRKLLDFIRDVSVSDFLR
jgi:SNF2 family DNA or RNA helicase